MKYTIHLLLNENEQLVSIDNMTEHGAKTLLMINPFKTLKTINSNVVSDFCNISLIFKNKPRSNWTRLIHKLGC